MIEPVALGQTRFHLPGLGADERGVAMGRRLLCLFTDIQRALGFFRSLSRAGSLKDVLGTLLVEEVRSQAGLVEIAIGFEAAGSFAADPCAAAARAHQGTVFTGTYRQFVPYRDTARPLGTDVTDGALLINTETGYALYHEGGSDLREPVQKLEFRDLLLRMIPQAMRPKELREMRPDALVLRVPKGLWNMVRGYIWRRRIDADISVVRQRQGSHFGGGAREVALIRCRDLPPGALSLMEGTPGVEVYVPVLDNVLVQRGWRHPAALESCQALFPRDDVILFAAARKTVERLQGPLQPISLDDTTRVQLATQDGARIPQADIVGVEQVDHLGVEVRLVQDPGARGTAEAVLVPRSRLAELMAVVHLMPQALWFGSEIALAEPFTVVLSPQGVRALPLGQALAMVHPRVFVPVGMRFSPPLSDELISDHFSLSGNDHIVFFPQPEQGPPFAISRANFSPLSRAAVHPEDLAAALEVVSLLPGVNTAGEPIVHHPEGSRLRRWNGLRTGGDAPDRPPPIPRRELPPRAKE